MLVDLPADLSPVAVPPVQPNLAAVDALAERLLKARRPLLWLGGGARGATAAEDAPILRLPEPLRLGMPLQRSRTGWCRSSEMEAACLASRVGLHHECGIVLPSDAQPSRLS